MPTAFDLAAAPGHLLRRAQQVAVELYLAEVGEAGPTPQQFALLVSVARHPGASQIELVRLSGIDRSTLAEMARRLVARGLLARRRARGDGRAYSLRITRAGHAFITEAAPGVVRAQERILALLPAARRRGFVADLQRMVEAGEALAAKPGR